VVAILSLEREAADSRRNCLDPQRASWSVTIPGTVAKTSKADLDLAATRYREVLEELGR